MARKSSARTELFAKGSRISKFVVKDRVCYGGMSIVYAVYDTSLGRTAVLKLLRPELADTIAAELMQREAQLIVQMEDLHDAFARVFERGIVEVRLPGTMGGATVRLPYYVMGRIQGSTFRGVIRDFKECKEQITIQVAVALIAQAAGALAVAHRERIIHRDIKPDNLMVSYRTNATPSVKVIDFGVAESPFSARRPNGGGFFGTPMYAAPEQHARGEVLPSTDIYSLTLVLFELLAGRPPFSATTDDDWRTTHLASTPERLRAHRPDVPQALDDFIHEILCEKNPRKRLGDAALFARRLLDICYTPGEAPDDTLSSLRDTHRTARETGSSERRIRSQKVAGSGAASRGDTGSAPSGDLALASTAPEEPSATAKGPYVSEVVVGKPQPDARVTPAVTIGRVITISATGDEVRAAAFAASEAPIPEAAVASPPPYAPEPTRRPTLRMSWGPPDINRTEESDMSWLRDYERDHATPEPSVVDELPDGAIFERLWDEEEDDVYAPSPFDDASAPALPVAATRTSEDSSTDAQSARPTPLHPQSSLGAVVASGRGISRARRARLQRRWMIAAGVGVLTAFAGVVALIGATHVTPEGTATQLSSSTALSESPALAPEASAMPVPTTAPPSTETASVAGSSGSASVPGPSPALRTVASSRPPAPPTSKAPSAGTNRSSPFDVPPGAFSSTPPRRRTDDVPRAL